MSNQVQGTRRRGIAERAFAKLFLKRGTVLFHDAVAPGFHLVELGGDALCGARWRAGDVIQIGMSAFSARTFTPLEWRPDTGTTRILGYEHGNGPASAWLARSIAGTECEFFGPRSAMDMKKAGHSSILLFGDETSFGFALAVSQNRDAPFRSVFEVSARSASHEALSAIGLDDAELVDRQSDDLHLDELSASIVAGAKRFDHIVLTGKAGSIQRVRQALRREGVASSRITAKAYWAPGKTGLD